MPRPVLIVGAGPVGLTAAVSLRQQGIDCRVVEKAAKRTNQSRAAIIHARTLELLESLGLAGMFLAEGVKVHGASIHTTDGHRIAHFQIDHLPTHYPYFLGLNQSETERLLTEELSRLNLEIDREVELTGFTQDDEEVEAQLRHGDGTLETLKASYLLGCDGSRSATRHQLGLNLEGETLDDQWLTADVRIDWDHPRDEAIAFLSSEGFMFVAAMDRDRWRIVANVNGMQFDPEKLPTIETVVEICNRRLGIKARFYDPVWISPFAVNTRMVSTMRVKRVFLLGDAAHVHSPVGGQGMNTGMQDAFNLAWKVALAVKGVAGEALLESYNQERHANAKRLLSFVGPATKMVNLHNPLTIAGRNMLMRLASVMGAGGMIAKRMSELDVHYRGSPIVGEHFIPLSEWIHSLLHGESHPGLLDCWDFGRGPRPGERAPEAHVAEFGRELRLFTDWLGDHRHQVLVFTGIHPAPRRVEELIQTVSDIENKAGTLLRPRLIRPASVTAATGLVDPDSETHHIYGARYECLYLIRPDGYVAFRSQPVDIKALTGFLEKIFEHSVI